MEWRRVHVLRPRVSTSAGQSFVAAVGAAAAAAVDATAADGVDGFIDFA